MSEHPPLTPPTIKPPAGHGDTVDKGDKGMKDRDRDHAAGMAGPGAGNNPGPRGKDDPGATDAPAHAGIEKRDSGRSYGLSDQSGREDVPHIVGNNHAEAAPRDLMTRRAAPHIAIIAGEPSGDFLGAQLAQAIQEAAPGTVFTGVGGGQMRAQGVESLFPYEELAVMGVMEILPNLIGILRRIRETAEHIKAARPDIVVGIDSPDFCFRVMKIVRREMANPPKLIHYVAPSVWAWRPGRAQKVAGFLDGLICLFDFEPPYFEEHGLRSVAVGHPLVEAGALSASGRAFRDEYGIAGSEPVLGVLFGSRRGELKRVGPVLRDAANALIARLGYAPQIVAPTLPHLEGRVFELLKDYDGPIHIVTDKAQKWNAFASFDAAMAVSGTVGLELAAMKVPHVIAYRANALSAMILRRMIRVDHVHLANIMAELAGEAPMVPEFLQEDCRSDLIAEAVAALYADPSAQLAALERVRARIGAQDEDTPSQKAAAFVLSYLA